MYNDKIVTVMYLFLETIFFKKRVQITTIQWFTETFCARSKCYEIILLFEVKIALWLKAVGRYK
jgi:hypothetical protein